LNLGQKIKYVRELRNLSQGELAEACGISAPYASEIESGKKRPSVKTLEKIAIALKTDSWFFMDDKAVTFEELAHISDIKLPDDVMTFLTKEESLPYLVLAKKLSEQNISPDTVEKIINTIYSEIKK